MNAPVSLDALFAPLDTLPGTGPKRAALLAKATGGARVLDLLFHLPERIAERRRVEHPVQAPADADAILRVTATAIRPAKARLTNRRYVEVRTAESVTIRILNGWLATVERQFPRGEARWVSGRVKPEGEGWSMANPEVARDPADLPALEPIHRLTESLQRPVMAAAIRAALAALPDSLPEWADAPLLAREGWPAFPAALRALHAPVAPPGPKPRERLAYDEALAGQVALGLLRRRHRTSEGRALPGTGALRARALAAFGHAPTPDQHQALREIAADLAAPHRMLRLLQGDVGSGKTLVAVLAMLQAVESGAQAALMAPTEILARQHARTLAKLCGAAGVEVALLAGSVKGAERRRVLDGLRDGTIAIAVGTHALFQDGVEFRDLGLAVVDEQHRFGVNQRLLLGAKGEAADMLVMTATPIPRTLQLTQWGEMQVSRIAAKPAGRQPITTRVVTSDKHDLIVKRLGDALARGERAYWVVRAIKGGDLDDSVAAEHRSAELGKRFPGLVGIAHGQQDMEVREQALRDFAEGKTRLLVATTVIEVGVDVPDATIMLIEQAERFGLSALHQLRGRVGRGSRPSSCTLVYTPRGGEGGHLESERLHILRDTEDGFVIAEEDLRLRGGGEALGTRQAGAAILRLALPDEEAARQRDLIEIAHTDAEALLHRDPTLASERGKAVRLLLRLFGKDEAAAYLKAG